MDPEQKQHITETLNQYAEVLDLCRKEMTQVTLAEEQSYRYAIARAYSKVLLTSCEIYTLMKEGFPEGALALSRSLCEALIIIATLLSGYRSEDSALIEKFFDALEISTIRVNLNRAKWILENEPQNETALEVKQEQESKLQAFKEKHHLNNFRDYWWTGEENLEKLADKTGFPKGPMYTRASGNVHFNVYAIFTYIDTQEEGILIGDTMSGVDLPLWYSTLCLCSICGLIHENFPDFVSQDNLERLRQLVDQTSIMHRKRIKL